MNRHRWCLLIIGALVACGCSGCRSVTPPVNYYVITAVATAPPVIAMETDGRLMSVGLRTVELPGYAKRLHLVKRSGSNRLAIADYHRWADHPDRMVQRVIGENLQILMPAASVYSAPWPAGLKPDRVVDISLLELIGTNDTSMLLNAVWTVSDGRNPSLVRSHRTTLSHPMTGSAFADLASAHDQVLALLSQEVAASLYIK